MPSTLCTTIGSQSRKIYIIFISAFYPSSSKRHFLMKSPRIKVNIKKGNYVLKNISYYSAFGHLHHFFQPICGFGVISLIVLFISLDRKIA